ncbi:uroporphyrinogen decarboxylase family protein [Neomoorella glycerini]|uniref:uroporphyrinogen decarboxylase family protein n=1 Tax=Neomoorella glycerini TaxID=55779 RepID=UPI003BF46A81
MVRGQLQAYELYGHDLVTVGIDIYNVEAEAMGCPVQYFDDEAIPAIAGNVELWAAGKPLRQSLSHRKPVLYQTWSSALRMGR